LRNTAYIPVLSIFLNGKECFPTKDKNPEEISANGKNRDGLEYG